MKWHRTMAAGLLALAGLLAPMLPARNARAAEPWRVEVQLVWGTDDVKSPDPKHKAVDPDLAQMLRNSPYRWRNYFEVNRQTVAIALNATKKSINMSEHCRIDIKNAGKSEGKDWVELKLYGEGKLISQHREPLPLVLAGDAKNDTAWLLVIRKAEAPNAKPPR